jgi:hypothetical protein
MKVEASKLEIAFLHQNIILSPARAFSGPNGLRI